LAQKNTQELPVREKFLRASRFNDFHYAKSKSNTSASFTPVSSTAFSEEMAAPSPVSSGVPFNFTLPRAT